MEVAWATRARLGLLKNRKSLAPTGIRTADRPARSQSLHQVRYLGYRNWSEESDHGATYFTVNEVSVSCSQSAVSVHSVSV